MMDLIPVESLLVFLTLLAFAALAWEGSKTSEKNPLVILSAGLLLIFVVVSQLFGPGTILQDVSGLLYAVGAGALLATVIMAVRKAPARLFGAVGLFAITVAALLQFSNYFLAGERGQLLVELGPDDSISELTEILDRYNAVFEKAFPTVSLQDDEDLAQVYLVTADFAVLNDLSAALRRDRENVDVVEKNSAVSLPVTPEVATESISGDYLANDPRISEQWGFHAIHGDGAHRLLQDVVPTRKARVAIIDTGVDSQHEDLRGIFTDSRGDQDANGHGTHCAGLAGGAANNGVGITSLNWEGRFVEIAGYDALGSTGGGTAESVAQAIIDAVQDGADVISLSLGAYHPKPPKVEVDAIEFALARGAIVVAAAGNSNENARSHAPANIDGVIAVAAVDQNLNKASFSNTNNGLSRPIAAPGVAILSTKPRNHYAAHNGTSMATPSVSGLLGVIRSINPDISAADAYSLIQRTGTIVRDSNRVGRVINAEAALRVILP